MFHLQKFRSLHARNTTRDITTNGKAMARLHRECEQAKRHLSAGQTTRIEVDSLHEGCDFVHVLTRDVLEVMCEDLLMTSRAEVELALVRARWGSGSDKKVDEVVLLGGSSRMPAVQHMLQDTFPGKPLCRRLNADEAVARGAAVQSAILRGVAEERIRDYLLLDVIPYSLGFELHGRIFRVVLPRNSTIPTKGEVLVSTIDNPQEVMLIKVYEGDQRDVGHNLLLGHLYLKELKSSRGSGGKRQVRVTFDVHNNGSLIVKAQTLERCVEARLVIDAEGLCAWSPSKEDNLLPEVADESSGEEEQQCKKQRSSCSSY